MKPIAIFYHCLFYAGEPPTCRELACAITYGQMQEVEKSGLLDSASHIVVGVNGGEESKDLARLFIPEKANVVFHGLESKAENLTMVEIEKWAPSHPGWNVLYFHAKGCTHDPDGDYIKFVNRWRNCMMNRCVTQWRNATSELESGYEAVGCHWIHPNPTQNYFAGNFWWATSDFLATLPSFYSLERVKLSGIATQESRYESEVWIGNGPRLPKYKDLETTHAFTGCP